MKTRIVIKEKTYDEQQYIGLMNGIYKTRRKIVILAGIGLVVAGVATFPVPCGSAPMIMAGGMLIFIPGTSIKKLCKQLKYHIKTKIKMRKDR